MKKKGRTKYWEIPIFYIHLYVILDDWDMANERHQLKIKANELHTATAWTIDFKKDRSIFMLLKSDDLSYWAINHELSHVVNNICLMTGMKNDPKNDEGIAYLAGWLADKVYGFLDSQIEKKKK